MQKKTALIIPCYNEEKRLAPHTFKKFTEEVPAVDLWFVDDGSSDATHAVISGLVSSAPERIFSCRLPENKGKAEAIRLGSQAIMASGGYAYLGYIDADLSAPLTEVLPLHELISGDQYAIVAGCRIKMAGKDIRRRPFRHYVSRIFATYYSQLLNVHNYDTQCGLKLFEVQFAKVLFRTPFVSRWLFDLELFLRAQIVLGKQEYQRKVLEVPLWQWWEVGGSRLKWYDFINAPLEVMKIYSRYRLRKEDAF